MRALAVGLAVAASTAAVALPAPAHAEVSAICLAHLAGLESTTSAGEDVRYHTMRGQFSPCTEHEAAEADRRVNVTSDEHHDEGKSRYCSRRWFC